MLIVIKFFVKDQSQVDSPELAEHCHPLLNWKRNQKNLSWMTIHHLGLTHRRGYHLYLSQTQDQRVLDQNLKQCASSASFAP